MTRLILFLSAMLFLAPSYVAAQDNYASPMTIPGYNPPKPVEPAPPEGMDGQTEPTAEQATGSAIPPMSQPTRPEAGAPSGSPQMSKPMNNQTGPSTQQPTSPPGGGTASKPAGTPPGAPAQQQPTESFVVKKSGASLPQTLPSGNTPTTLMGGTAKEPMANARPDCPPAGDINKDIFSVSTSKYAESVSMKSYGWVNGLCHLTVTLKFTSDADASLRNQIFIQDCFFSKPTLDELYNTSRALQQEGSNRKQPSMAAMEALKKLTEKIKTECTMTMDGKKIEIPTM